MYLILENYAIDYVVDNPNDNFFFYLIRITISYIIKLYKIRTQKFKTFQKNQNSRSYITNEQFLTNFNYNKEFKELVILSKYVLVL